MITKEKPQGRAQLPRREQLPALIPILAELLPKGDGTFVLQPKVIDSDMDTWLPAPRAGQIIGLRGRSIYRLITRTKPLLVYKRPLKNKLLVSLKSVKAYIQATNDPDFWSDRMQQSALEKEVQAAMKALCGN
jgi:hypothetical protein